MKAALISDTHGFLPSIPVEADFVIHAGDVSYGIPVDNADWYREKLSEWCEYHGKRVFATFGNHDAYAHRDYWMPEAFQVRIDEPFTIVGVKCWFSPWSLPFYSWSFMATEEELAAKYALIPDDTQVIVSHGPPFTYGDLTYHREHVGSKALRDRMRQLKDLKLVVTGHIHEARGSYRMIQFEKEVEVVNATIMNARYQPVHAPVVVEWPPT